MYFQVVWRRKISDVPLTIGADTFTQDEPNVSIEVHDISEEVVLFLVNFLFTGLFREQQDFKRICFGDECTFLCTLRVKHCSA